MKRISVTTHAVEQFVSRYCGGHDAGARVKLELLAATAHRTGRKAHGHGGGILWLADGGVAMVAKEDHPAQAWVIVTVLPPSAGEPTSPPNGEVAEMLMRQEQRRATRRAASLTPEQRLLVQQCISARQMLADVEAGRFRATKDALDRARERIQEAERQGLEVAILARRAG